MTTKSLLIPVKVDFLLVKGEDSPLAEAKVDFSRMPYNDGKEDFNSENAYISENFLSQPFQNNNLFLRPGVHLHWAIPNAFAQGEIDESGHIKHRNVPDRWLVYKLKLDDSQITKVWIVESNYLHPVGKDNDYHAIAYPVAPNGENGQPFRYMGRAISLSDKDKKASIALKNPTSLSRPDYLEDLTAVGYGEPTFAAFYPNCHSVFGLHDDEIKGEEDLKNYSYEVFGWYEDENKDPVRMAVNDSRNPPSSVFPYRALKFDGSKNKVSTDYNPGADISEELTIEAWIRPEEKIDLSTLVAAMVSGYMNPGFALYIQRTNSGNGQLVLEAKGNHYEMDSTVQWNVWQHVAVTVKNDDVSFYLNGKKQPLMKGGSVNLKDFNSNLTLGEFSNDTFKGGYRYKGVLSEVRLWKVARSQQDIQNAMYRQFEKPQSGLLVYYKFDEGNQGGNNIGQTLLRDSSGNDHHGTLVNFDLSETSSSLVPGNPNFHLRALLKQEFDFDAGFESALPGSVDGLDLKALCYGRVSLDGLVDVGSPEVPQSGIAIGNTGTEALSAWISRQLGAENDPEEAETILEALQMVSKVASSKLDQEMTLMAAFHEKGFSAVNGGLIWSLRVESKTITDSGSPHQGKKQDGIEIALPESLAHQINELNVKQQALDRANDELKSRQQLLYSDWCKYMMAAYHPDIEQDLPNMDDVRFFIRNYSMNGVLDKKREIHELAMDIKAELDILLQVKALFDNGNQDNGNQTKKIVYDGTLQTGPDSTPATDPVMHGIAVRKFTGQEDVQIPSEAMAFNSISFWVNISSHQPNKNGSTQPCLIQVLSAATESLSPDHDSGTGAQDQPAQNAPSIVPGSEIGPEGVGAYWQSVYINGESLDPYEVIKWKDFPQDEWIHVYLQGSHTLSGYIKLMEGMQGEVAGIRAFKTGLSELELFCDMNMFKRKELLLKTDKGPRYWQPTEPVVLIEGDIAEPTDRHGSQKDLPCLVTDIVITSEYQGGREYPSFPANWENLKSADEFAFVLDAASRSQSSTKPWHPMILEWKVGIIPLDDQEKVADYHIPEKIITGNYRLEEDHPDLVPRLQPAHRSDALKILSGSTVLTPYANQRMKHVIEHFLQNLHADDPDWLAFMRQGNNFVNPFIQPDGKLKADLIENAAQKLKDTDHDLISDALRKVAGNQDEDGKAANTLKGLHFSDWEKFPGRSQFFQNPFIGDDSKADPAKILEMAQNVGGSDRVSTSLAAYKKLQNSHILSQSMGGFNAAMQMLHQTFQIPMADPLGFKDDQEFTKKVKEYVQGESKFAPLPLFEFDPIRTGRLRLLELNIIDSFGQIKNVYTDGKDPLPIFAQTLKDGQLPPRIAQPARLNFRWLSAADDEMEMNAHPASSPVCGWLVPNNLDDSLMVFDQDGNALGSVAVGNTAGPASDPPSKNGWHNPPGVKFPVAVEQLPNPHLRDVVNWLLNNPHLGGFMEMLESTLDQIDPENFAQHTDLAIIMGRPIAIVRASLGLEAKGEWAVNQSWEAFEGDMNRALVPATNSQANETGKRQTNSWEKVIVPARIGQHGRLNDGVLGYWKGEVVANEPGSDPNMPSISYSSFHSILPKGSLDLDEQARTVGYNSDDPDLKLCFDMEPQKLTLLLDPRGKVHAACGVLPTKVISVPDDQFKPALKKMSVSFFLRPLLMPEGDVALPLPTEPGYEWSWLYQTGKDWREISTIGVVHKETFTNSFKDGEAIWAELVEKGWIEEMGEGKATVVPRNQRKNPDAKGKIAPKEEPIQHILDAGHIIPPDYSANPTGSNSIREGWLTLTPKKS